MSCRILIAEDEPKLLEVLCDYFESKGVTPIPAADGAKALDLARSEAFDGVLLDIMMPKLNGLSVCRELRKSSDVPIIFLTALSDEEDKLLGFCSIRGRYGRNTLAFKVVAEHFQQLRLVLGDQDTARHGPLLLSGFMIKNSFVLSVSNRQFVKYYSPHPPPGQEKGHATGVSFSYLFTS